MTFTSTHNDGRVFYHNAQMDIYWQWQQYPIPIVNLEPSICTILPVVNLNSWQKVLWKSRQPVEAMSVLSYCV